MHLQTSNQPQLDMGFYNYTCNWGTHFAGLYENDEERDQILMGFLYQGTIDKDLQLYCPVERSEEDFISEYGRRYPDNRHHLHNPQYFQLQSARELYYPNGVFSPWAMQEGLDNFFEQSQQNGPRNIRATAEMAWALEAIPGVEYLMAYESRLNYFIPNKPWISICLYNVNKFSGSTIMNVLRTHPYTINGGVITANPYYQDPDTWLAKNAPEFLSDRQQETV